MLSEHITQLYHESLGALGRCGGPAAAGMAGTAWSAARQADGGQLSGYRGGQLLGWRTHQDGPM